MGERSLIERGGRAGRREHKAEGKKEGKTVERERRGVENKVIRDEGQ
jgi:hypothetical protein